MKKAINIFLGILVTVLVMAIGFYFFLFLNPLNIYNANLLKWIPVLIGSIAMILSGIINKYTPNKLLPLLFIPYCIFDLFSFLYFPFIFVLIGMGVLALVITRANAKKKYKILSSIATLGIFLFFLFLQPLKLQNSTAIVDTKENLIDHKVLWDFTENKKLKLPSHVLKDQNGNQFNLKSVNQKTHLITFWATWCSPCMQEKEELEKLKSDFKSKLNIGYIDISFDDNVSKWKRFIDTKSPLGIQLISNNQKQTRRLLQIGGIPIHFIVNSEGVYKEYHSLEAIRETLSKSTLK